MLHSSSKAATFPTRQPRSLQRRLYVSGAYRGSEEKAKSTECPDNLDRRLVAVNPASWSPLLAFPAPGVEEAHKPGDSVAVGVTEALALLVFVRTGVEEGRRSYDGAVESAETLQ